VRLHAQGVASGVSGTLIGRIATSPVAAHDEPDTIFFARKRQMPPRGNYLAVLSEDDSVHWEGVTPTVTSLRDLGYLEGGDVVALDPSGFVRTLYRRRSPHNFLLATEQCNSFCLMCSQPPRAHDDFRRMADHFRVLELMDPATEELGITGGEPTLYGAQFIELIARCERHLPRTAVHVLTNGRLFYYRRFAERLASVEHHDLVLGIPLYSDVDSEHDYIVQARGAYEQTILGMLHLDRHGVAVEIRVVLHKLTIPRLSRLAEFIVRNLPFATHIALMGLEMFGFVHLNLETLWIDPVDYADELRAAVGILARAGMNVSIYNHQLCTLDRGLWPWARRSISDWKNVLLPACAPCAVQQQCGGFFQSGTRRHSRAIHPIGP
jgi:His-Xaa-Ser system radical SAM maturase HxsC